MPTNILMPALSPTMEKGNLAKWLKKEGDTIKSGDVIAEIETDKATMEVEAVDEGVLAKIVVPEGTADVPVNQLIGLIAAEGEDAKAVAGRRGRGRRRAEGSGRRDQAPRHGKAQPEAAPPSAKSTPSPAPPPGAEPPASRPPVARAGERANGETKGERVFASPLARRIAKDAGIDIASIKGSGPHGRVVEQDVKSALRGHREAAARGSSASPRAPARRSRPACRTR